MSSPGTAISARRPPGSARTVVPAARPAPQPADALGAGRAVGGHVVTVVEGGGRDVVAAGARCDAPVETTGRGIALDASAVGPTDAGALFGPDRAARGWGPLHAEIARSNAIAPAQSRRHTALSIPGWRDHVHGTPQLETLPRERTPLAGRARSLLTQHSRNQGHLKYRISVDDRFRKGRFCPWLADRARSGGRVTLKDVYQTRMMTGEKIHVLHTHRPWSSGRAGRRGMSSPVA